MNHTHTTHKTSGGILQALFMILFKMILVTILSKLAGKSAGGGNDAAPRPAV